MIRASRPIARLAAALALSAVLGVATIACSSDSSDGGASQEVEVGDGASVDATTTAAPAETTTTVPPAVGRPVPAEAVQVLYDAWHADDKVTAATVADPDAVEAMWQTVRGDYALYNQCDSGEFGTSGCLYRGANGTIQFTSERRGDAWVVVQAFYSAP